MKQFDYIIVGQGLAGSAVIQRLNERGKTFIVFDAEDANQASKIASGIWNPLTLKRMKKSWLAEEMLQELYPFYAQTELLYKTTIQISIKVNRLFTNAEETNEWIANSDNPSFESLLDSTIYPNKNAAVNSPFGYGQVAQSGRIDTEKWLFAIQDWLLENNLLIREKLNLEEIIISNDSISYQDIKSKGIIFCEGKFAAFENPFFKHIPFSVTKGELLEIYSPTLNLEKIINSGVFIMPIGNDHYKIGATYDWDNHDLEPTQAAREEMLSKLTKIISCPFEITKQSVGIRPTVKDRRPLVGTHPTLKNVHIFNGMGSRGVFMAPFLSKMFVNFLLSATPMHKEADIARFEKLL